MLVFPDGSQRGTLGGGCVEAEVKQRALAVLSGPPGETPRPEVLTFSLDEDYGWDDGLICGGRMTILADPLTAARADAYFDRMHEIVESGAGCIEAITLDDRAGTPPGSRFLFDATGQDLGCRAGDPGAVERLRVHLPDLSQRPGPVVHQGVAYLPFLPRITLLIVGGGHVGQAVARLAAEADFDIEVLDDRASYISQERFPTAKRRLEGDISETLRDLASTLGPDHYTLIVTRGHRHDEEALYHLATTRCGYVGMIGSKRKIRLIYDDLMTRGIPAKELDRVHAPLGFDIGSQTVPEIAISIVAELIARRNLGTTTPRPRQRIRPSAGRPGEPVA